MIFNKEISDFIYQNYKGIQSSELTDMVNRKFNTSFTIKQVQHFKKRKRLNNGVNTLNTSVDIGTHTTIDGIIYVKTTEGWKRKHRLIYEECYGKIPKGHALIFLDGDKTNVTLENLKLVTKREQLYMNKNHMYSTNPEITEVNCTIAKLMCKKQELVNKRKENERT